MIWILLAGLFVGVSFGFIYPILAVLYYKIRYGRRYTIRRILEEIGY